MEALPLYIYLDDLTGVSSSSYWMVGRSYLFLGSRPLRIVIGLKSDIPSILLEIASFFNSLTTPETKVFLLASERRATLLNINFFAILMSAIE